MIQRIQSLFLFIVIALGITLFFLPVIQFSTPDEAVPQRMFELGAKGLTEITTDYNPSAESLPAIELKGVWGLSVTTLLIPALALVILLLFKKRIVQVRLSLFLVMLCIGYYGILFMYVWFGRHNVAAEWDILFGACIPLLCLVFTMMAIRKILKDEALVRSADRLR